MKAMEMRGSALAPEASAEGRQCSRNVKMAPASDELVGLSRGENP